MKQLLQKSLEFIKSNPSVIFSLALLVIIPLAIFFNTYYVLKSAQSDIDAITQSKVVLAEDIANVTTRNLINNPEELDRLIKNALSVSDEIKQFELMTPNPGGDSFKIIASSENGNIGKDTSEIQNALAWNREEGIGFIGTDTNHEERLWKITKIIKNTDDQKIGLISLAISLGKSDALMNATITRSYFILFFTVLVVLLLVANNTRLFSYALTVAEMKEVDKMKDNFISMASHELRSPLTAISGYLEFFNDRNKNNLDEDSVKYLKNIDLSIDRLNLLVNDILDVSRLEGNRVPFNIARFDPQAVILKSVEELRPQAIEKNLELAYSSSVLPTVIADVNRVEQILINLISNAVKYTPKGKVEITTETKNKELLITVADTGMGISSEDLKNMFEKFYRVKTDETKHIIGTGLGLWLSREMARKMNGDLTVESIKGVGSHFTLHLPVA